MILVLRKKHLCLAIVIILLLAITLFMLLHHRDQAIYTLNQEGDTFIEWVDFNVPASLLQATMDLDVATYWDTDGVRLHWIELLAYLAAKYGDDFSLYTSADLDELVEKLQSGQTMAELTEKLTHYPYYFEAYSAVLGGFLGEYEIEVDVNGTTEWQQTYGLKAFSPIAQGFSYSDFDDFGNGRNYGFSRRHLGHDMIALTGTPVIAVESGIVEILGWNQYGGWRIGIRSFDGKRYYYYGHLRQNRPYAENLAEGDIVMAGDVIGYVGRTGYSKTENTNGIKQSHLHYGLQLVFDESQKESDNEIWIDLYEITKFLSQNRSETWRDDATKEHYRVWNFREVVPEDHFVPIEEASQDEQ